MVTNRGKLALVGLVAGALSGLFGIGGGLVIVPALVAWCGRDQRQAVATSFLALGPLALVGVIGYAAHGEVDLRPAVPLIAGSVIGAWIGAALLHRVPLAVLRWVFAVTALVTAAKLALDPGEVLGPATFEWWRLVLLLPTGVIVGMIGALTGIGGGALMIPAMQLGFHIPATLAKGTSLLVILPTSVLGGWRNLRNGNGSLPDALWIGAGGVLAAAASSQVAVFMNPVLSDVLFGCFLVVVAFRTVWGDVRTLIRRRSLVKQGPPQP
ncbi:UPF0721 transmembrane protein [Longimycelium tulufanense]|uniref:Probable membrane transporter protein n=1 Tax=Longimycelium tulufanense TaxID=907463 RepID=A0A8J3CGJ0_9PSEU|nr:sulfite exporter TauE/SafE family protein [Longimycelium tulufanense]GGM65531.1 UPF0721 transmembrane protein [Longimycelium tulufanense]